MTDREKVIRPVRGYEGYYEVDNFGKVYSVDRVIKIVHGGNERETHFKGKEMRQHIHPNGYMIVGLTRNGKTKMMRVHRIVAEAFIPNPGNLPYVIHKDENKTNNIPDNLEWCTPRYNILYNGANKRAAETKRGRKHTQEHKNHIADGVKAYYSEHESKLKGRPVKHRKPVTLTNICTGEKIQFPSVTHAGIFVGNNSGSNVRRAIRNGTIVKGYRAMYTEGGC